MVMWFHLKSDLGVPSTQFLKVPILATNLGAIGVDIFFVISGFVIAMTASKLGNNWRAFLAHRIARIVPLYFAVSGYLLIWTAGHGIAHSHSPSNTLHFRQIFNTFAFIPVFDNAAFSDPLCANGWTLSFEMWFYICFAFFIKPFNGRQAGRMLPCFMAAGAVVTAVFYHSNDWFLPKFLFHPLTLEFCAGCILFHARNLMGRRALLTMCFSALVFLYFANKAQFLGEHDEVLDDRTLGFYRAGVWGGFAVCLVGVVTQIDLKHNWKWPSFLLLLGDASYSIYLVGSIVSLTFQSLVVHGINKLCGFDCLTPTPLLCGAVIVLGTIFGGILTWKFFEVPTTLKAKKILSRFVPKTI